MGRSERIPEFPQEPQETEVIPLRVEWYGPGLLIGREREQGLARLKWLDKEIEAKFEEYYISRDALSASPHDSSIRKESKTDRIKRLGLNFLKHLAGRMDIDKAESIEVERIDGETGKEINEAINTLTREINALVGERDLLIKRLFDKEALKKMYEMTEKLRRKSPSEEK